MPYMKVTSANLDNNGMLDVDWFRSAGSGQDARDRDRLDCRTGAAAGDAAEGSLTAPLTGRPQLGGVLFRRAADLSATCGGFCGALSAQIASSGALRSGQHAGSLANAWDHR